MFLRAFFLLNKVCSEEVIWKNRENVASQTFSIRCRITYSKQDVRRNHKLTLRKFKLWKIIWWHLLAMGLESSILQVNWLEFKRLPYPPNFHSFFQYLSYFLVSLAAQYGSVLFHLRYVYSQTYSHNYTCSITTVSDQGS